ncbi:Serine/threonine protein kinase [Microbacterium sp. 8M]|uniref:serine/threonine-protein kinase n=1 Tax=Microbacterium sp. 8M TaxID=2653153 RepID=UPI0012EFC022|nr:serine/threonine-protein kinase [Microbacterium sp. 8M]VXC18364.1 Serine/threonine protein kinase [Microbacterium sp. 8M]
MHTSTLTPTDLLLDGRYRLCEHLGSGASADVYRAEDLHLDRIVAVKLLRETTPGERPHRETALLASLDHPSLVTLLDAQLSPGRQRYLVMEYIDGPPLSAVIARGALDRAHAAVVGRDLADALALVHASGAVHRDVKPSNVLMRPSAGPGWPWRAVLADFGIARGTKDMSVTAPGITVGTAAYMATELFRGNRATPASDVYALGVLLLEALTGVPAAPAEAYAASAERRAPIAIPEALGSGWVLLLQRMTSADPEERPSAAQVSAAAADLAAVEAHEPVPTARISTSPRARSSVPAQHRASRGSPPGRVHLVVAACVGALIAVGLAVAGIGGLAHPDAPQAEPSNAPRASTPTPAPQIPSEAVQPAVVPAGSVVPAGDITTREDPGKSAAAHAKHEENAERNGDAGRGGNPHDDSEKGNPHDQADSNG